MRPIHSLIVVVLLALVALVCWLALGGGEEEWAELPTVAPAAATVVEESSEPVQLTQPGPAALTNAAPDRVAIEEPAPAPEPRAAAAAPSLAGLVTNGAGQPVAGARVLAGNSDGMGFEPALDTAVESPWHRSFETTTDQDGRFELTGPRPGGLRIAVRASGFAPHDANNLVLPAGGEHELEPIALTPSVVLTGRVVSADGRGIAGAELIRLERSHSGIVLGGPIGLAGAVLATTAVDGSFTVDQLAAGSFSLRVTHPDHPDRIEAGKTYAAGERVDGLTIVLDHGFQIHGRVTGLPRERADSMFVLATPEFEDAAGRMVVRTMPGSEEGYAIEARRADLAADGSFVVRGLREGQRYSISARRNREGRGMDHFLASSLSPRVIALAGDRGIELEYKPEGALLFQVVDAKTGAPITNYQAEGGTGWLVPMRDASGGIAEEHPEGRGRIGNLRPKDDDDTAKLRISAVGYREQTLSGLVVRTGEEFDLGIIALDPVPVVRVTVTDRLTGEPVRGARATLALHDEDESVGAFTRTMDFDVSVDDDGHDAPQVHFGGGDVRTAITDDDGVAVLTSFEGEPCQLSVVSRDHAPYKGESFVPSTTTTEDVAVGLGRGGSVTVTMVTAGGEPVAGAQVEHRAPGEDELMMDLVHGASGGNVTDSEGRVTFAHLAPGTHAFRPQGAGGSFNFSGDNMTFRVRREGAPAPQEPGWVEAVVVEGGSAEVSLVAPVRVSVEGRITQRGEALEGATVALIEAGAENRDPMMAMFRQGGSEARTDGSGYYKVENVRSGDYTVRVTHPDRHMPAEYELELGEEARFFDVDLSLTIVEGKVTDVDGNPIAGVRIWPELVTDAGDAPQAMFVSVMVLDDGEGGGNEVVSVGDGSLGGDQTFTDSNGNYTLQGLRDGVDIVIRAEGPSVKPGESGVLRLAPDEHEQNVDLKLGAAGELEIVAEKLDGKPAKNLIVIALFDGPEGGSVDRKTGFLQNGSTVLDGLTPGPWRVEVRQIDGLGGDEPEAIPEQVVEVEAGETAVVIFQVP